MPHTAIVARNEIFDRKKAHILKQLSIPESIYTDASPKGTIDIQIRDLIDTVNSYDGLVTTSSCSGRISVFQDGDTNGLRSNSTAEEERGVTLQMREPCESPTDFIGTSNANGKVDKEDYDENRTSANNGGGKGGGGKWLYVSHSPLHLPGADDYHHRECPYSTNNHFTNIFNLAPPSQLPSTQNTGLLPRLIHFKFEPLILHILSSTISDAQKILSAAQQAGFRESGAMSLPSQYTPELLINDQEEKKSLTTSPIMVAIRSTGLALDCIIGIAASAPVLKEHIASGNDDQTRCENPVLEALVSEQHLRLLVNIANDRFKTNTERTERLRNLLKKKFGGEGCRKVDGRVWEDAKARKDRKRREGLRQQQMEKVGSSHVLGSDVVLG